MAVRIITDSTVDIADKYRNLFTVVPLTVSFGEKDYIDGVTLNKQEFYQKLVSSSELPKTSQATPATRTRIGWSSAKTRRARHSPRSCSPDTSATTGWTSAMSSPWRNWYRALSSGNA